MDSGRLVDITSWIREAAASLPEGSMVKRPDLRLLDAMNSIEMMEPRMDTGVHRPDQKEFIFNPQTNMAPEELCWVMDEMLALEVAWYQGVNLAQSVFRCLYYLHPDRLDGIDTSPLISTVFKAYLLGYCKCVDLAFKELSKGHLHDVEDCWMDHYGIAVHLEDSADDMIGLLEQALDWLRDFEHPYRDALISRLQLRVDYLICLHLLPGSVPRSLGPLRRPPEPTRPPSTPVFDDVTPFLRQSMPPSQVTIPDHATAWCQMSEVIESLQELEDNGSDLLTWEVTERSRAWLRKDLNIVRSLSKTFFDERIHNLAGRYVASISELPDTIFTLLEGQIPQADRQQYAIWRDIVGGLAITTLSTPTLNRPRQRRSYQSLSFSWRERAAMAERLGLGEISIVMHAIRLDCLLEGALAAFDAELISTYEEKQAWWWINRVATARSELGLKCTWQSVWAEMWAELAQAMFLLLLCYPRDGPDTKERFEMRHKWAIKLPTLPDGSKVETGLSPRYEDWCAERAFDATPEDMRRLSMERFTSALTTMKRLLALDLGRDPRDFFATMSELRQDVCHNMAATTGNWGQRRRWLLLLL